MKQDSRCRHTYVYIVYRVSLLSTTFRQFIPNIHRLKNDNGHFLGALPAGSTFLNISVLNVKLGFETY